MRPSVGVVIPTRGDRPQQLRAAVLAASSQDHPGETSVVVVADGVAPEAVAAQVARLEASSVAGQGSGPEASSIAGHGSGPEAGAAVGHMSGLEAGSVTGLESGRIRVLPNTLTPGLPGARNTGIAACDTELIAFCDDDDLWLPGKLAAQVAALESGDAEFASCGIEVEYGRRRVPRLAGTSTVTRDDLLRSRMVMVHASTFLFRRGALWADESAPGGQNEDWDLALRAAKRRPIANVDRPLVRVRWGSSHYVTRWADRIAGLEWMLARHPELAADPRGSARVYGQLAFHHAALGHRRQAGRWAVRAFTARAGEPRVPLALAVATGLVSAPAVLSLLHDRGHGI